MIKTSKNLKKYLIIKTKSRNWKDFWPAFLLSIKYSKACKYIKMIFSKKDESIELKSAAIRKNSLKKSKYIEVSGMPK